jgi:hypothetical protein
MPSKNEVAKVATVKIGLFEFEGLMLPDGKFGIGISQLSVLFPDSISHSNATKYVKRLLRGESQLVIHKIKAEVHPKKINVIGIEVLLVLIKELVKKQDKEAIAIASDLIGLSLQQLFCDAFGKKFEQQDRQEWLIARQEGKQTHKSLTDAILAYADEHPDDCSDNYRKWRYKHCADRTLKIVFNRIGKKLREDWGVEDLRGAMTQRELMLVDDIEGLATRLIEGQGLEPLEAVVEAGNRLEIVPITR